MAGKPDDAEPSTWGGETPAPAPLRSQNPELWEAAPAADLTPEAHYRIESELARGGMGAVMIAFDRRLGRRVALKQLLEGAGPHLRKRFMREAEITARLQHPGIVPVYEAGRFGDGPPFYAMKKVEGRDLETVISEKRTLDERLAMLPTVIAVCEAIAYAHSQGVVHRDIKPANVLVGAFGETVVVDWGLAKPLGAIEQPSTDPEVAPKSAQMTRAGAVMGTPSYMPPEQAAGEPVDERADVYALGAMLYTLLTGRPPYEGSGADVLATITRGTPPTPAEKVDPGLPSELADIIRKAMSRKVESRYRNAAELADDLKRFQSGQLVGAHSYSRSERILRAVRRYKWPLALVIAGMAGLSASAAAFTRQLQQAQARETARADEMTLLHAQRMLDQDPTAAIAWLATLSPGSEQFAHAHTVAADAVQRGLATVYPHPPGHVSAIALSPDQRWVASAGDDGNIRVHRLGSREEIVLAGHTGQVWAICYLQDGRIASVGSDGTVRRFDVTTGVNSVLVNAPPPEWVTIGCQRDVLANVDTLGALVIDASSGREVLRTTAATWSALQSPDGATLILTGEAGVVDRVDVASGVRTPLVGHSADVYAAAFSPDGTRLVTASGDQTARLWDTSTWTSLELLGHTDGLWPPAFSPDGKRVVTVSADGTARVWDATTGAPGEVFGPEPKGTTFAEWSHDASHVAVAMTDGVVWWWEPQTGERSGLRGHSGMIRQVIVTTDGTVVSTGTDGTVRAWLPKNPIVYGGTRPIAAIDASRDGRRVIALDGSDGLVRGDLTTGAFTTIRQPGEPRSVLELDRIDNLNRVNGFRTDHVVFAPDGGTFVASRIDGSIEVWGVDDEAPRAVRRTGTDLLSLVTFTPEGRWLVTANLDGTLSIWSATGNSTEPVATFTTSPVRAIASLPTGGFVTGAEDGAITRWSVDLATGATKDDLIARVDGAASNLVVLADGTLFVASSDRLTHRFDLATGAHTMPGETVYPPAHLVQAGDRVIGIEPGTSAIASVSLTGRAPLRLESHEDAVNDLALSPDNRFLASASSDGTVRIWDLADTPPSSRTLDHRGPVTDLVTLGDGSVLTASSDGSLRRFVDPVPSDPAELEAWIRAEAEARGGEVVRRAATGVR